MPKVVWLKLMILLVIVLLGGLLRFVKLAEHPIQLNHDEISQLYDAISIAQTKKDIYGNFLPIVFPSFGVYIPGHYIYITALTSLLFGNQELTIRIPAALAGSLLIVAVFIFVYSLFGEFKLAALSSAMIAITPSEIFYSRKSFEYMIGHCLIFLGTALVIFSFKNKKTSLGFLGVMFLGLSMYTYAAHVLMVPIILSLLIYAFKKDTNLKKILQLIAGFVFSLIPLILILLLYSTSHIRTNSILITQDFNLHQELLLSDFKLKTIFDFSFDRLLSQLNPSFLFSWGLDLTSQGPIGSGPLLIWQLPLVFLGFINLTLLRNKKPEKKFLLMWIFASIIPTAITFEQNSPHRIVSLFTLLSIVSAIGFYQLMKYLKNPKVLFIPVIILLVNFIYFTHIYLVNYPYEKSWTLEYPFKAVAEYAWQQSPNFEKIVFDPTYGNIDPQKGVAAQYYLGFYGHYSPREFQKKYKKGPGDEYILDNISIRSVDWTSDKYQKKTLFVASPWRLPINSIPQTNVLKTFTFYDGEAAFYAVGM